MCQLCRDLTVDVVRACTPIQVSYGFDMRENIAAVLTRRQGVCPEALVANTLVEEPCDGMLGAQQAHFAWREQLRAADDYLRTGVMASADRGVDRTLGMHHPRQHGRDRSDGRAHQAQIFDLDARRLVVAGQPC